MAKTLRLDEVGYWSELKLEIIDKYAKAYSIILEKQGFEHSYIDAFAGAGQHIAKRTGEMIAGSPLNALNVSPPFRHYYFIDLDGQRARNLELIGKDYENVEVFDGDCNDVLLTKIYPKIDYKRRQRALCLLDPYGLHLNWDVIRAAGQKKSIEIFLNFPIYDININVLKHDKSKVLPLHIDRMNRFWGDSSWESIARAPEETLFGAVETKQSSLALVNGYRERLKTEAGFAYVADALPMYNSSHSIVYYLVFASPNETGGKIVREIFKKYRK